MPRNASGIYTLPSGNPVVPGTTIDAAWANDTMEDMANEITNSLSRTGAGGMLAPFRIADGTVTAPGLSYLNETNTGLYRSGAGSTWMSVLGVNTAQFSTVGVTIPFGKALTAAGNASVGGTFAVGGAAAFASSLSVVGAITATGGVTGNVTGNVTAASGTSSFNDVTISGSLDMVAGSSATITGLSAPTNSSDAANKGYVDAQVATRLALTGGTMSGAIAMNSSKITGLGTPAADDDAATKAYVDSVAQGLDVKASCRAATTGNITLSGAQTIDGVAVVAGDRVLVKDQSSAAFNGIYVVASGAWARSSDANTWAELVNAFTFIEDGTVNDNSGWVCTIGPSGIIDFTTITFEQFSGAGQITAGTGMTKSGNTLNVNTASSARIVVNTDNIDLATTGVTAGTYTSVTIDAYGRATGGTNPTTLSGYGITDAYTQTQVNTLVNAKLSLTGGTMSGVLAMGANKITGLADPTLAQDAATKNYIDTIFGSTTTAAASAAAAASSASAAATSATNAAASATNAATSATNSANSYTTFNNQYLGSKTSDPTVNNTGGALVSGNLYWNSSASEMRVYNGSAWVAAYIPAAGYLALTGGTMSGVINFAAGQTIAGYQTTAGMSAYLTTASAASTYQTIAGMSSYLTTATAASTYQTQAAMSSYLTSATAASTYATLSNPTTTGTLKNTGGRAYFGANNELFSIGLGYNGTRVNAGQVMYLGATDATSPDLVFSAAAGTELARLTGTGNLGIGTSSPNRKLEIAAGTSGPALRLTNTNSNSGIEIITAPATYSWLLGAQYNVGAAFEITPSTAVGGTTFTTPTAVFTQAGNVFVGATSGSGIGERLGVTGAGIVVQSSAGANRGLYGNFGGSNLVLGSYDSTPLEIRTGNTARFLVGTAGQLGIGGATYGTSGQVLTSQGSGAAPTWADAGGGSWTYLSTVTASGSANTVDVENAFSSTYDMYVIVATGVYFNVATVMGIRFKLGGAYSSSGYSYQSTGYSAGSGAISDSATSWNKINMTTNSSGIVDYAMSFIVYIPNPWNAGGTVKQVYGQLSGPTNSGYTSGVQFSGTNWNDFSALTGVRFMSTNGSSTITGKFRLYGIKNS